jgi:hypothetical protein
VCVESVKHHFFSRGQGLTMGSRRALLWGEKVLNYQFSIGDICRVMGCIAVRLCVRPSVRAIWSPPGADLAAKRE